MPEDDDILEDEQQGDDQGSDTGSGTLYVPLRSESEAKRVAEHYASLKTPQQQRRRLLNRILVSPDYIPQMAPIIIEAILRAEIEVKHNFLELFTQVVASGKDLSIIAESLSKLMVDANFGLREKAAALLVRMGPSANGATLRTLGMLRSKMADVQVNALRLLGAIGPLCAKAALPKIESMLRANLDKEVLTEARETIRILRGEVPPEVEQEKVMKIEANTGGDPAARRQYANLAGRTVLVVDDDEGIRRMVANALRSHGAQALESGNGKEALEMLKSGRHVDLLITDLLMPQMNGAEMLRMIREDKALTQLPVYVISARTERTLLLAMAKLGVAGYFMKPFKLQEILERVNATFQH